MLKFKNWMLGVLVISVMLTSCGETIDESQVLVEFLESVDSPVTVSTPGIAKYITAADVQALLPNDAYIIDIRSEADYNAGHIAGATWVDQKMVIAHLDGADTGSKQLVIACYTGQTAGFVSSLVNLSGYSAKSLKFGMSGWNNTLDKVAGNSKNLADMVTTVTEKAAEGALPALTTGYETGQEILDAQIAAVNEAGFSEAAITSAKVLESPGDYYIVNYWPAADYDKGHLDGAIQYTPHVDILSTEALSTLPTDKTIVVYCYSGQTSAFTAAYLQVLGYDAKSLKFGVNGMATDWAATNGFFSWNPDSHSKTYELVTD